MTRRVLAVAGLALLAACFPPGHTYRDGPWVGCTTSLDGSSIDCPYPMRERGAASPGGVWTHAPPVEPGLPEPWTPTDPVPDPPPAGPAPPCDRPGWGHGSPHGHCGPPGHDKPHTTRGP